MNEKIKKIITDYGFTLTETKQDEHVVVSLNRHTPAGEDWWMEFVTDGTDLDFFNQFDDYYEAFNVDDEAEFWIQGRGQRGTPTSIRVLLEDAEWKDDTLGCLAQSLREELGVDQ